MSFTLHNNSLHWKEECLTCQGAGGWVRKVFRTSDPELVCCGKCNGEGHTCTKVEVEKPKTHSTELSGRTVRYVDHLDKNDYNSQLSLIKELEEALGELENCSCKHGNCGTNCQPAKEKLSKYTLSEGKIKKQ